MRVALLESFGLNFGPSFIRDRQFYLALAVAPLPLIALNYLAPGWNAGIYAEPALIFSLVIWQPLVEELLFRGFIQGRLRERHWARHSFFSLSTANYLTTLMFVVAHLVNHSIPWAIAVAAPSLVFGYFRDRQGHIYSSIALHSAYNACYLASAAMPAG
jgi:membrane protease YdiL (CAAX protease family)